MPGAMSRNGSEPVVTRVLAEPRSEWYIKVLQPAARRAGGAGLTGMLAGMALGAGLMYMLDPARGRRRQSLARDKVVHWMHALSDGLCKSGRDIGHRVQGLVAETRACLRPESVDDNKLALRVRAAMGRVVSHAHAVRVDARDGVVILSGPILAHEVPDLINTVRNVRGVRGVEDQLEVHTEAGAIPALQGVGSVGGSALASNGVQTGWSPATRTIAGAAGVAMAVGGLARGGVAGALMGGLGAALAARGLSNVPGGRGGGRAVDVQKTININRPLEEVFEFFSAYDNFPFFMSCVREVRDLGQGKSHWVVAGPLGMNVEWDAQVTRFEPNRLIAWKTIGGAAVENGGVIRFQPNEHGGTRVDIKLTYRPPGGALGHVAAMLFGADPKSEMDADLMRLKSVLETGKRPHDAARNPPGRGGEYAER